MVFRASGSVCIHPPPGHPAEDSRQETVCARPREGPSERRLRTLLPCRGADPGEWVGSVGPRPGSPPRATITEGKSRDFAPDRRGRPGAESGRSTQTHPSFLSLSPSLSSPGVGGRKEPPSRSALPGWPPPPLSSPGDPGTSGPVLRRTSVRGLPGTRLPGRPAHLPRKGLR